MANPTIVVLVAGGLATLLAVGFVVLVQLQRVRRAYGDASRVLARMQPVLAVLAEQQQVTGRELERVSQALDRLHHARAERRRR